MKHYYLAALFLFCFFLSKNGFSQNITVPCGADFWLEKSLQDPVFFQKHLEYEKGILQVFEQKKSSQDQSGMVKTIPVVVHIVHDGGAENLSDAQVQQALSWLNQALANQGYFNQGSGADCGIQLCFAQRTPDGQPTNGITRDQSPFTVMQMETQDQQVKNLNRWKSKDYVNIWLVRSICSSNYGCNVYGYANYPFAHGSNIDGIVIEAGFLTEIEKVSGLAHEMGHYLGLYHTFEGGCTNTNCLTQGDRICDTPPDQSTASLPCTETFNSCSTDTQSGPFSTDQPDMTRNFLDYGILACFHDYTPDQATRMNATLDGIRKSLLESKGCLPPCPANTVAGFTASATTINVGQTVTFNNTSQNAGAYTWTVNGTSFGTQANATYTFTAPGTYTVLLTALPSNTMLCEPSTAYVTIQVLCVITASFSVSDESPDENETILLLNTSQNALVYEWFVNGISQGNSLDSISFNSPGDYQIQLVATNGPCTSSAIVEVQVLPICDEENRLFQMAYQENPLGFTVGKGVAVLEDGNLLSMYETQGSNGRSNVNLVKMTPAGQQLWAKTLGDSVAMTGTLGGLIATSDGGFAITFYTGDSINHARIGKFSSDGDLLWLRQLIGGVLLRDLVSSPDGKITACGLGQTQNENSALFVQFDANGGLQWIREYKSNDLVGANSIAGLPDGGFIALGASLFRLSANGDLNWQRQVGSKFSDVVALENGEFAACGKHIFIDGAFVKFSSDGHPILSSSYSGINGIAANFTAIIKDAEKGFVLTTNSNTSSSDMIVSLDSVGNVNWARRSGMVNCTYQGLAKYNDIGYVLTGSGNTFVPIGRGLISKTDRKGRIGDCPSMQIPIEVTKDVNIGTIDAIIMELPAHQLVDASIAVHNWPIKPDTLCASGCAVGVEICNNKLDDDEDGLFDCLDPECNCTENECSPKQYNIWHFGYKSGLNFDTDPPTQVDGGMTDCTGISATMCDVKGNLLFYTDGLVVYNRFHQPMPNGTFGVGDTANQSIIIPYPANANKYFIIVNYSGGQVYSSILDMTLSGGNGDIVAAHKNIQLDGISASLAAVKACSFNGYWLLTRSMAQTSQFHTFRVDQFGLWLFPIASNTGTSVASVQQIKIAPDGSRVACTYRSADNGHSFVSIYDFASNSTGFVSNPLVLGEYSNLNFASGVEFSPNGRFLYVTGYFPGQAKLIQFDLEAGDLQAIKNSKVNLATLPGQDFGYPQLAPNGKIYMTNSTIVDSINWVLGVIHQPNVAGVGSQYVHQDFDLSNFHPDGGAGLGLCNVIASYYLEPKIPAFSLSSADTICVLNTPINYQIENIQCDVDSISWRVENLSTQIVPNIQNATIRYLAPGTGRLIATVHTHCGTSSDTLEILVVAPLNITLDLGPDRVVCDNGVFSFNAGSGFARYLWSDGTADSTVTT
nr:PKD domain-containing protein [Saprospiraceae bacterium]